MPTFRVPVEIEGYIQINADDADDALLKVQRLPIERVAAECERQGGYTTYEPINTDTKCTGTAPNSSPPSS